MRLAIIPARGGSTRIPRKNIRPFAGRPIIAWSIAAARDSGMFDHVMVSTEDDEIAAVAIACGAEVPFRRPAELSDNHTGLFPVLQHAIRWYAEHGKPADYVCCILAIAPFVLAAQLREGYERLVASGKSYAFPVTTFACPIQRALRVAADGSVTPFFPEEVLTRSQDLQEAVHDASQFYWGRAQAFLDDVPPWSPASLPLPVSRHLVQDIDTPEDWRRAELLYAVMQAQEKP